MSGLFAISLGTGIACGIWGWVTFVTPLISFVGFAGTTTYFFRNVEDGYRKTPKCLIHNLTGIGYALLAIYLGKYQNDLLDIFMTGFISFMMVYQGKIIPYLDYPPAAFIGCFTTFAAGGYSNELIPSFIAGYMVALGCDYIGRFLNKEVS